MRWKMCPKCGVKMNLSTNEKEVEIYICPICKDGYLTISGELLKEVKRIANIQEKDVDEILLNALRRLKNYE